MAEVYVAAFPSGRAWTALEIADLIGGVGGFAVHREAGFAIGRAIAGEAELVTLAVAPEARRQGEGRALLSDFERAAKDRGAEAAFLEVAADNTAARALYGSAGYDQTGLRAGYYKRADGTAIDALILSRALPLG